MVVHNTKIIMAALMAPVMAPLMAPLVGPHMAPIVGPLMASLVAPLVGRMDVMAVLIMYYQVLCKGHW